VVTGHIGERIAAYRRRRGLSQSALAGLVGRSESWLSQVERGVRSVDRLSVLLDMARVLHVEVESLTGRPWQYAPNGSSVVDGLDEVRRFFSRYDNLLGVSPESLPELPVMRAQVAAAHESYQAARYEQVIGELPGLLGAADALFRLAGSDVRREALLSYVSAYAVAAKLLTKMGAGDLALLAADRCATAAVEAESVAARGIAAYQVVCALLRADRPEDAEPLAIAMAEQVQSETSVDEPSRVSVAGALWLIGAIIAARRGDRGEAWQRLDVADGLADQLGRDANIGYTAFGSTNVAIHRVSVAAELGDPAEAVRVSSAVDPDRLPAGLLSRRAQMHLDLAWAQSQRKRDADAVLHLMEAEQVAPEAVRYNVVVQELIRELLVRQKRTKTSALHRLAVRAGVLE
jgi:transcriptional regulator with XRE-family HTH domain